jgi:hypothetical protein
VTVKFKPGDRFARLLILEVLPKAHPSEDRKYLCRCDCGREKAIRGGNMRPGNSTGCGCGRRRRWGLPITTVMPMPVDETPPPVKRYRAKFRPGDRWEKLTIVAALPKAERPKIGRAYFRVRCDCGVEKIVRGSAMRPGGTSSCGCRRRRRLKPVTPEPVAPIAAPAVELPRKVNPPAAPVAPEPVKNLPREVNSKTVKETAAPIEERATEARLATIREVARRIQRLEAQRAET